MKRKDYEKPAMQVYELQKHAPLICTSGLDDPTDYPGQPSDPFTF